MSDKQNIEVVMITEFAIEISSDGGKIWDFTGESFTSEQVAVQKKWEIETYGPGVDVNIVPIDEIEVDENCYQHFHCGHNSVMQSK